MKDQISDDILDTQRWQIVGNVEKMTKGNKEAFVFNYGLRRWAEHHLSRPSGSCGNVPVRGPVDRRPDHEEEMTEGEFRRGVGKGRG